LVYWLSGAELFVCTDAAGHPYDLLPCLPDVVIGDFDSLTGRLLSGRDGPRFLLVRDQDTTDSEKALLYVIEDGCTEAILLGATGWRLDHTLFNCSLLERYANRLRLCLSGYECDAVRVDPSHPTRWDLPRGTRFSVFAPTHEARGVTLVGAQYPLTDEEVRFGGPAFISNRVSASPLIISLKEGSLLVTVERNGWPARHQDED
jgi:thiamine pyrophosphokinase